MGNGLEVNSTVLRSNIRSNIRSGHGASRCSRTRGGTGVRTDAPIGYSRSSPRAISSAGERFVHTEEATGSIPVSPTAKSQAAGHLPDPGRWPVDHLTV